MAVKKRNKDLYCPSEELGTFFAIFVDGRRRDSDCGFRASCTFDYPPLWIGLTPSLRVRTTKFFWRIDAPTTLVTDD